MRVIPLLLTIWFVFASVCANAQEDQVKKLIECGWDIPYPDFIMNNIERMEKRPFNGIIFHLRGLNYAFELRSWNESELRPQMVTLAAIKWKKFTDNFIVLQSTNKWGMNWFDDAGWSTIAVNLGFVAKAAKVAHCVGICLDPEPYGLNPWVYSQHDSDKTFPEVEIQVRKRGAEFISALQKELPELRLLTFFQLSQLRSIAEDKNPVKRQKRLSESDYALLPAFLNGMLDAAGPGVRIIDGNEPAYYYTDSESFDTARRFIKEGALVFIAPENQNKYRSCIQAGMAIYVDNELNLRQPESNYLSYFLSPQERLLWFEHNAYYALEAADEYAWCYSERMDWWREDVPFETEQILCSVRKKIKQGEPLGFAINNIVLARRYYGFQAMKNDDLGPWNNCPAFIELITAISKIKQEQRLLEKQINALQEKRAREDYTNESLKTPEMRRSEWEAQKQKDLQVKEIPRKSIFSEKERIGFLKKKDAEMYKLRMQKYNLDEVLKNTRLRLKNCIETKKCGGE